MPMLHYLRVMVSRHDQIVRYLVSTDTTRQRIIVVCWEIAIGNSARLYQMFLGTSAPLGLADVFLLTSTYEWMQIYAMLYHCIENAEE